MVHKAIFLVLALCISLALIACQPKESNLDRIIRENEARKNELLLQQESYVAEIEAVKKRLNKVESQLYFAKEEPKLKAQLLEMDIFKWMWRHENILGDLATSKFREIKPPPPVTEDEKYTDILIFPVTEGEMGLLELEHKYYPSSDFSRKPRYKATPEEWLHFYQMVCSFERLRFVIKQIETYPRTSTPPAIQELKSKLAEWQDKLDACEQELGRIDYELQYLYQYKRYGYK